MLVLTIVCVEIVVPVTVAINHVTIVVTLSASTVMVASEADTVGNVVKIDNGFGAVVVVVVVMIKVPPVAVLIGYC